MTGFMDVGDVNKVYIMMIMVMTNDDDDDDQSWDL